MPQASDLDREKYQDMFGDIGCEHAIEVLSERGYHLNKDWTWDAPHKDIPKEDVFLLNFLMDEWDFGGVRRG